MTKNSQQIKRLVGIATLTALVVGLQFLSNYVSFGSISITLALIPIAMGAILYGPLVGAFLGAVMGLIIISAPSTVAVFIPANAVATVFLCILKSALAGLASGYVFKLFAYFAKKNKDEKKIKVLFATGIIVAALVVPIVNTTLFIIGSLMFFMPVFGNFVNIINAVITTNFLVEFIVSVLLSPALVTLVKILTAKYDLAFTNDFSNFNKLEEENIEMEEVLQN